VSKHIIVHPGGAHLDEILATGLVCRAEGELPVYRARPTDADLADPEVWVLDVGMRHEPELRNFDHHQLRDEVECAMSLVARHLGLHELLSSRGWYPAQIHNDVLGPKWVAEHHGLDRPVPEALASPLDLGLIQLWMDNDADGRIAPLIVRAITRIVDALVIEATLFGERLAECDARSELRHAAGLPVLFHDVVPYEPVSEHIRARLEADLGETIPISIGHDSRGRGWALNRLDDDPRVDFHRIVDDPRVMFAHHGGFVAKTDERVSWDEVAELISKAVIGG
jgi:hypothetical protein